jgi:hypothetical protein
MQAISRFGVFRRSRLSPIARLDGTYWLLQPIVQTVIGVSTVTALLLLVLRPEYVVPSWGVAVFLALLILGFGGTAVGVVRAELSRGSGRVLRSFLLVPPYVLYCWSLLPIYIVAWYRLVLRRDNWAKTAREAIT